MMIVQLWRHCVCFGMLSALSMCGMCSAFAGEVSLSDSLADGKIDEIWFDDWDTGIAAAKVEKRPVLVDFYSDGCGACKAMHKYTFSSSEIKKRLSPDWICIRINTHGYKSGTFDGKCMNYHKLAQYFRVRFVPTFIFLDTKQKPIQSIVGYKDKELFGAILDYIKNEVYKKGISFKEYKENKSVSVK